MALSRIKDFAREKLLFSDLNAEFDNFKNYVNNFLVVNPLNSNLNFGSFSAVNFSAKLIADVVIASEYSTLNAAFDALPSTGGVVYLPPHGGSGAGGEYEITAGITPVSNTLVIGGGWDSIVKVTANAFTIFEASSISNIWFMNFKIDGNDTQTTQAGISFANSSDCGAHRMRIIDVGDGSSRGDGGDGIVIDGASRLWISESYITGCSRNGVSRGTSGSASSDVFIVNNKLSENGVIGLSLEPLPSNTLVSGNLCLENFYNGILCALVGDAVENVRIVDNVVTLSTPGSTLSPDGLQTGLGVSQTSGVGTIKDLTISRNHIKSIRDGVGSADGGIGISVNLNPTVTHRNIVIDGNIVEDCDRTGILLAVDTGTIKNASISGNNIHNSNQAGTSTESMLKVVIATPATGWIYDLRICDNVLLYDGTSGGAQAPNYGIEMGLRDGGGGILDGNYVKVTNTGKTADIIVSDPEIVIGTNRAESITFNL